MRSIIVLCAVLACATAAAGEVYKWKDKDGRVHYGDKPKTQPAEAIMTSPDAGPSAADIAAGDRAQECAKQKALLETYKKSPTLSEVDGLGRKREFSAAERDQFLGLRQQKVDEICAAAAPSPSAASTFPPPEEPYAPVEPPSEEAPAPN